MEKSVQYGIVKIMGKDWILAGRFRTITGIKIRMPSKYSSDGKFCHGEDQTIRLYEDTQPSTINIVEGESYLDSALCGQDFYLLVKMNLYKSRFEI